MSLLFEPGERQFAGASRRNRTTREKYFFKDKEYRNKHPAHYRGSNKMYWCICCKRPKILRTGRHKFRPFGNREYYGLKGSKSNSIKIRRRDWLK
jgi:hypothetical protein